MTSIESLFDWILEDIFVKVTRRDRLTCKEVCKRWYNILMERGKFREDRHIYIFTNQIKAGEAPISVLMQAPKPYQIYTVSDSVFEKNRDIIQLFEKVGTFIEEFNYRGRKSCWDILTTMPSLKCLTSDLANDLDLEDVNKIFSQIKKNKPNFNFRHLEKLQLGDVRETNEAKSNIKIIKGLIPQNCSIVFSYAFVSGETSFENLRKILEVAKFKRISCGFEVIKNLIEVGCNVDCDVLEIFCSDDANPYRDPYSILQVLQNKYENLEKIELYCSVLPPVDIEWPKITSISLETYFPSLKSLEKLTNLENLRLYPYSDGCGFVHEKLCMPKLKELKLETNEMCGECKRALAGSFENLDEIHFKAAPFYWNEFREMIDNWKKLTIVNLDLGAAREIEYADEEDDFDPKESVDQLIIYFLRNLQKKDIKKISEAFPNLIQIQLFATWSDSSKPNIIKAMIQALPKLISFYFSITEKKYERKIIVFNMICDALSSVGFPIENEAASKDAFVARESIFLNIDRKKMTSEISKRPPIV